MTSLIITRRLLVGCACLTVVLGVSGCGGSSKTSTNGAAKSSSSAGATTNGSVVGQSDTAAICKKLAVSDAQALIRPTLSAAVVDDRLGGCTFVLPGNQVNGSNLTVGFEVGGDAASRYQGDITGTFSAGGSTVNTGIKETDPLPGIGDKAVWGSTAGYPMMSALKGDVYCTVTTTDDATKLTIVGTTKNPLPEATQAQQLQYAQLEGKLCIDLFSEAH